ncbi:unnamed protein product, partial [Iphiclides podalirius]
MLRSVKRGMRISRNPRYNTPSFEVVPVARGNGTRSFHAYAATEALRVARSICCKHAGGFGIFVEKHNFVLRHLGKVPGGGTVEIIDGSGLAGRQCANGELGRSHLTLALPNWRRFFVINWVKPTSIAMLTNVGCSLFPLLK